MSYREMLERRIDMRMVDEILNPGKYGFRDEIKRMENMTDAEVESENGEFQVSSQERNALGMDDADDAPF